MTNKISFSCLFVSIIAFGFSGMVNAQSQINKPNVKQAQSISFSVAPNITVSATGTVRATASSKQAVMLASTTTSVCSIKGTTVTGLSAGLCTITANQLGNTTYAAASQVSQSFTIKLAQTISFGTVPSVTAPGTGALTVSASSGLPVILVSKSSVCSISGNLVTGLTAGTCVIAANQAGDTVYAKAPEAIQSFRVTQVQVSGGDDNNKGNSNGGNSGNGGTKLAVTAPFDCKTLASSGNAADDGRRAYNRLNCVSCHGQDGSGGMGPNIKGGGDDVAEAVNGEGAMPSYAGFLCPNDVIDLQAYLGNTSKIIKYLDWDLPVQQIKDAAAAATPTGVVAGP